MKSHLSLLALVALCPFMLLSQTGCSGVYSTGPAVYGSPAAVVPAYGWGGAGFYGGSYYNNAYRNSYNNSGYYNNSRGGSASWNNGSGNAQGYRGGSASWGGGSGFPYSPSKVKLIG